MNVETITEQILLKMPKTGKVFRNFFIRLVLQWLYQRGRYCFDNLARQGFISALSCRSRFSKGFDFLTFNTVLVTTFASSERVLCFDPSYIPKSGTKTDGLGRFWSGCAQSVKKGLEIACIAVADVQNHTAFHLLATQTIVPQGQTLMDFYVSVLLKDIAQLLTIARYLVVDAYFAKANFINPLAEKNLQVITRLRDDAALWYRCTGERTGKRGRPKLFGDKVNVQAPDPNHFTLFAQSDTHQAYEAVVWSKSLKRQLKVVVLHSLNADGRIKGTKLYACTDTGLAGQKILQYYQIRFQQEFIFRDAKQFLGLTHCQSTKKERLHFHFNISLTVLSLAKVAHWLSIPSAERPPFSIQSMKTLYTNKKLLDMFINAFGICPETAKNNPAYLKISRYAKIAA